MDLGALATLVFSATTVVAATLAALAYGVMRTLRESNGDLRARVTDLEKDRTERDAKIAELKALYDTARQIATGEVQWEALVDLQTQHQKDARAHWAEEIRLLAVLGEARNHWAREVELIEDLIARWDAYTAKDQP